MIQALPSGRHLTNDPWHLGLYSRSDVSRYGHIPPTTVNRWLERRGAAANHELVGFDEFVTLLFVRRLRGCGVRFRDIVAAEHDLRQRTGHEHPFVHEALWVAGRDVLVRADTLDEGFMAANRHGQLAMTGVVRAQRVELPNLVIDVRGRLAYDQGRVSAWRPMERITARPGIQFGLTCIEGTRLTTGAVFEAFEAGDDPVDIARLYRVTPVDVGRAIEWERQLAA